LHRGKVRDGSIVSITALQYRCPLLLNQRTYQLSVTALPTDGVFRRYTAAMLER
jgi:hypothetical protein